MALEDPPCLAPPWAPSHLTSGVLTLDVSASYIPTLRIVIRIGDLPRGFAGGQWTTEGLIAAIEDRAFRRVCFVMGVYLCGPAPAMRFGPSDSVLAFFAPKFGTPTFWRRLQLHGAYRVCSFEWPPGMTLGAGPTAGATASPPARRQTPSEDAASREASSPRGEDASVPCTCMPASPP
jgi:hypothetical protein